MTTFEERESDLQLHAPSDDPIRRELIWERVRGFLGSRKRAYQHTFNAPAGRTVLADLAKFCRANATCFDADPRIHAVLEGRREVWLRMTQHLNLTVEELAKLYGQPKD
jgi:hypothetical protein